MKSLLVYIVFLLLWNTAIYAQGGTWTWMSGDTTGKYYYGTKGVPDTANQPPGRYECAYWIDLKGNLWIFGSASLYNDLWKYDIKLNEWIWVNGPKLSTHLIAVYGTKGVPSTSNYPSARGWGSNCWTDRNGDLWLLGGDGYDSTGYTASLNDLWRYHIATNEWTWMGGSKKWAPKANYGIKGVTAITNTPAGVDESKSGWVDDSNNLWMFGGGTLATPNNNMWKYSTSSNEWTYMKGDTSTTGLKGRYGKLKIEDSTNLPPALLSYVRWKDKEGNFYIYSSKDHLNNIWRFNPKTNNWTWVWGDSTLKDSGLYRAHCSDGNRPAPRYENTSPAFGNNIPIMWNFGGFTSYRGVLNDLWYFDPKIYKWNWVSGSAKTDIYGHYGTKGAPSIANTPSARYGSAVWVDSVNNLWVFSGSNSLYSFTSNDLWKFTPDTTCVHITTWDFSTTICQGQSYKLHSGKEIHSTGIFSDTLTNHLGHDSIIVISIMVIPVSEDSLIVGICQGYSYTTPKGKVISTSGIYYDTLTNYLGCDSIVVITLFTHPASKDSISVHICQGKPYILPNGDTARIAGLYIDTLKNYNGCDSIVYTNLNLITPIRQTINASICNYQTYILPNGLRINAEGIYNDTFTGLNECDSIITTNLRVYSLSKNNITAGICFGHTYTLPKGKVVSNAGTYSDTLTSALGCDSIIITALKIIPPPVTVISIEICEGQSYTLPKGKVVSTSGTYCDTFFNHSGCDSIIAMTLNVLSLPVSAFSTTPGRIIIEEDPTVILYNESLNWSTFKWIQNGKVLSTTGDTDITFSLPGIYCFTLKTYNSANCMDTITHCITVVDTDVIAIPTAFTPNGDGNNDIFFPLVKGNILIKEFRVYNRWGELMYDKPVRGWDGTYRGQPQPQGTYIYIVVAENLLDPSAPKELTQKGDVELIR